MSEEYNLEKEFGWFLDGIEKYILEDPDDPITHYGIKGMKWGVRRSDEQLARARGSKEELKSLGPDKIVRKTSSGETLTMTKHPPTAIHKGLAKISSNYRREYESAAFLNITDGSGKKIGDANVQKKSDDELYLVWLGINKSARGKGYATAAMKAAEEFGSQQGFKKMTLEVPGHSPDAIHIYKKLGFESTGKEFGGKNDYWGGLTEMTYTFDKEKVKHFDDLDDVLAHYGIKGMKWGVRRTDAQLARARGRKEKRAAKKAPKEKTEDALAAEEAAKKAKKDGVASLTNKELQALNQRLNLETQYKALSKKKQNEGESFANELFKGPSQATKDAANLAGDLTTKAVDELLKLYG